MQKITAEHRSTNNDIHLCGYVHLYVQYPCCSLCFCLGTLHSCFLLCGALDDNSHTVQEHNGSSVWLLRLADAGGSSITGDVCHSSAKHRTHTHTHTYTQAYSLSQFWCSQAQYSLCFQRSDVRGLISHAESAPFFVVFFAF